MNPLLEAALRYADRGWPVFSLAPGTKVPMAGSRGYKDASTDAEQIAAWWAQTPSANVGVATGGPGPTVLDLDCKNGLDGVAAMARLGDPGPCPVAGTPSDGMHLFYSGDVPSINAGQTAEPGIEIKAAGAYVVVAPSVVNGRAYRWHVSPDDAELCEPPAWVRGLVERSLRRERVCNDVGDDWTERADGWTELPAGRRNDTYASMGGLLRKHGAADDAIERALAAMDSVLRSSPIEPRELAGIARSVAKYPIPTAPQADAPRRFKLMRVGELLETPKPVPWLIRRYLPDQSLVMLVGPSGSGKSLLAADWACAIATGEDWHGRKTERRGVAIIAGEGHYGTRLRLKALETRYGDLSAAPIYVSNRSTDLANGRAAAELEAELDAAHESTPLGMVIIDTLNRNMSGDENSAESIAALLRQAEDMTRRYACAVLVVTHTGHGPQDRARGSSALRAGFDVEYVMTRTGRGTSNLACSKMKDGETPEGVGVTIEQVTLDWRDADGEPMTTAIATAGRVQRSVKPPTPGQVRAFEALLEARDDTRHLRDISEMSRNVAQDETATRRDIAEMSRYVALEAWREAYYAKHVGDNDAAKRQSFLRARRDLVELRAVIVENDHYAPNDAVNHPLASHAAAYAMTHAMPRDMTKGERDTRHLRDISVTCHGPDVGLSVTTATHTIGVSRVTHSGGMRIERDSATLRDMSRQCHAMSRDTGQERDIDGTCPAPECDAGHERDICVTLPAHARDTGHGRDIDGTLSATEDTGPLTWPTWQASVEPICREYGTTAGAIRYNGWLTAYDRATRSQVLLICRGTEPPSHVTHLPQVALPARPEVRA